MRGRESMWQEELKKYIRLTGKEEMNILLQEEKRLTQLFNLYTTNFNPKMLDNLLELLNYDHINRHFTLELLETLYDFCISQEEKDFFMRCIDIMAYGSHIYRGLESYKFEHPLFSMNEASRNMIISFENCVSYIDELSDSVDEDLQEQLMKANDSLIYPMETLLSSFYQDIFLPQVKMAIEQSNQKALLHLFRKYIMKTDLYLQGLPSSKDVLEEVIRELEEWVNEESDYTVKSTFYALENEVDIYQSNSQIYHKQKALFNRYRNTHHK